MTANQSGNRDKFATQAGAALSVDKPSPGKKKKDRKARAE
jgi:hypothetical protein